MPQMKRQCKSDCKNRNCSCRCLSLHCPKDWGCISDNCVNVRPIDESDIGDELDDGIVEDLTTYQIHVNILILIRYFHCLKKSF